MLFIFASLALAAPPSSRLTGPDGALTWTVTSGAGAVTIAGRSPKWAVDHVADPDLRPRRTTHTDTGGATITNRWVGPPADTARLPIGTSKVSLTTAAVRGL